MQKSDCIIGVEHVSKFFGDKAVLNDVNLSVRKGEFVTILGPSGCGKTTLLRLIAGFQTASEGVITIAGKDITQTPPHRRPVNTVFQKYALFPHLNVFNNIAFGLKLKKLPAATIEKKVKQALRMVGMTDYEDRDVDSLSGGQQQRVALARILASEPQMLLLDEPFSALDSFLKEQLLEDMIRQLSDYAGDVIMVSHSRDEIYQFCDRLLILDQGRVIVTGDTKDIFDQPGYREAARLTGCKNITEAIKIAENSIEVPHWHCTLEVDETVADDIHAVGIRAHYIDVLIEKPENMKNVIGVTVENVSELPFEWYCFFRVPNGERIWWKVAKVGEHGAAKYLPQKGAHVYLHMPPQSIILLK